MQLGRKEKGLKGRFWGHGVFPRGVNVGEKTWDSSLFPRVLSFLSFGHACMVHDFVQLGSAYDCTISMEHGHF